MSTQYEIPVSETQAMKQLGNSVAIPAIQVVAEKNNWETWVMQYNKGEWSKLYASLVIFNEWSIPAANHNLNETKERYYFLEAIREDAPGKIKHTISKKMASLKY